MIPVFGWKSFKEGSPKDGDPVYYTIEVTCRGHWKGKSVVVDQEFQPRTKMDKWVIWDEVDDKGKKAK